MFPRNAFGSFARDGRSYRVTNPDIHSQLYNVFYSDDAYYAQVSHFGTGTAHQQGPDGQINNITEKDQKTLYCRDEQSGEVWCPGVYPMMSTVTGFLCEHHDAYTSVSSTYKGIRVSWRLAVPLKGGSEIWTVTVENRRSKPAAISIVPAIRLTLTGFKAARFFTFQDGMSTCDFLDDLNGLYLHAGNPNATWPKKHAILAASTKVAGYCGDPYKFFGATMAMNYPKALLDGEELGSVGGRANPLFLCLQCRFELAPKSSQRTDFLFAMVESPDEAKALAADIAGPQAADAAVRRIVQELRRRRDRLVIRTPNGHIDAMTNQWVRKGLEFSLHKKDATRDNLQFADGICMSRPDLTRREIIKTLSHQYAEGWSVRSWVPMDTTRYGDCHLWMIMTVCRYLKFTGDLALLDEVVPYQDKGAGTVLEHLERAIACTESDRGPNGIPRIRFADWNDGLTLADPQAESVMVAMMHGCMLLEMAELMRHLGRPAEAEKYVAMHARLKDLANRVAWDEQNGHYLRGFADGKAIGGRGDGQVFINPQTWAIMGDMVPPERLAAVLKTIDGPLDTPYGSAVNLPGYSRWDPRIGRISAALPGTGENSGCYCHVTGFKVAADCLLGRGDQALRSLLKLMPDSPQNPAEKSGAIPFALTSSYSLVTGKEGKAGRPWLTGTACWFMRGVLEGLLGIHRAYGGFLLKPAFPSDWDSAQIRLQRQDDIYDIRLRRGPTASEAIKVTLNGKALKDNFLHHQPPGAHKVVVTVPAAKKASPSGACP